MFEYKHGSNILYFPGLCMSEVPGVRDWQEGGFSACLCAPSVAGEFRSPILGLLEETFLDFIVAGILCGQCTRVCEEKGFCSILYSCYLWGRECFCSVFAPCLKRQHKGMGCGWQSHWFFLGYFPAISSGQKFNKGLGWDEESSSVVL